jgi:hypothetical protein
MAPTETTARKRLKPSVGTRLAGIAREQCLATGWMAREARSPQSATAVGVAFTHGYGRLTAIALSAVSGVAAGLFGLVASDGRNCK